MLDLYIAIISAAAGQILVSQHDLRGLILYALALVMLLNVLRQTDRTGMRSDSQLDGEHASKMERASLDQIEFRRFLRLALLPMAVANALLAYLAASKNTYRWYGVVSWLLAIGLFLTIFWARGVGRTYGRKLGFDRKGCTLSWTTLAVIGIILVGFWFRFWRLAQMPTEMTSDHIEKLLDVQDLVTGQRPIFFVRNTGREPWQFYWTLMFIRFFDLDTKFLALKLGSAAVGMLMLPGIYLLGRNLFGRSVGLWATLFAAVASWPVILGRIGLRFPFAPAATAWSLLFLLRGLRDGRRNDFLLLGLWLGIGLHGYTAFRAMPVAVVLCWGLALVIRPSSLNVRPATLIRNALLTVLIALVVFIPLGRFSIENPDDFWRRSFSRIVDPNQPTPDAPVPTLISNITGVALMFHWKGDDVWVNALVDRPVLDPLLGGLLVLGLATALWRGLRFRDPIAPLLLVAGVILLLPSALSIAYPIENPSVVRTGGAIPIVVIIAALPLGLSRARSVPSTVREQHEMQRSPEKAFRADWRRALVILCALSFAVAVTAINYRRYFSDYWKQYDHNALNTTEIASAIYGFMESGGDPDNAWIVAWPYWIDTRGVGIEIGDPYWNNVILDTKELNDHAKPRAPANAAGDGRPRFYVLHREDWQTLGQLHTLFPEGWSSIYVSEHPDRSFVLFYVPRTLPQGLLPDLKGMAAHVP